MAPPSQVLEILLVEDNPRDGELALRAMRDSGLLRPPVWARDGAEALDLIFGTGAHEGRPILQPAVIFLDLKLPKVDGLEVLRRVKADPRTATLPIVVLTSSRETPDIQTAYQLGANSYIVKPVAFDAFAEAVGLLGRYWLLLNQPPDPHRDVTGNGAPLQG